MLSRPDLHPALPEGLVECFGERSGRLRGTAANAINRQYTLNPEVFGGEDEGTLLSGVPSDGPDQITSYRTEILRNRTPKQSHKGSYVNACYHTGEGGVGNCSNEISWQLHRPLTKTAVQCACGYTQLMPCRSMCLAIARSLPPLTTFNLTVKLHFTTHPRPVP